MSEEVSAKGADPEFSYPVTVDSLPRGGKHFVLTANEDERKAVSHRLGVPSIAMLEGKVHVRATHIKILIKGRVDAALTRECVASLQEMEEVIGEDFEIEFLRHAPVPADNDAEEDWLNAPDVHAGPVIDLGEQLIQQLSLAMEPFPRLPNASSLADQFGTQETRSPFAEALAKAVKSEENQ